MAHRRLNPKLAGGSQRKRGLCLYDNSFFSLSPQAAASSDNVGLPPTLTRPLSGIIWSCRAVIHGSQPKGPVSHASNVWPYGPPSNRGVSVIGAVLSPPDELTP